MQPGGVNDWVAASLNRPLTTADRVWTDKDSRAELNVGDGFVRMNSETSLTLTNVSDNTVQLELDQGTLSLTVRHLQPGEIYEVDTPNFAFTVMKSGVYRFDAFPTQDQSWVTVRSGWGQATGKGPAVRVNSGMQVRFNADNSLQHVAYQAPARDGFDDWAQVRDKRLDDSVSARYVSPGVIGYQDLDAYGRWVQAPTYGAVWVPTSVPAGWAPYRYGHWTWIAPWGWTWVDDQPWGFAPFHYGRWVTYGGGWGWAPGPYGGYWNPYYAPALVGWIGGPGFGIGFGWGGGWGVGIGFNFGWFPLGWGEPFYPRYCGWGRGGWYRGGGYVTGNYFRNVNITNTRITNINNYSGNYYHGNIASAHYGFRNTPGAVTGAPRSAFTTGAAVNRVGGAVPNSALGKGNVLRGVDANPTRESVLGGRSPQTHTPPASAFSRSVVTKATPPQGPARLNSAESARNTAPAANHGAPEANHGMTAEAARGNTGSLNASRTPSVESGRGIVPGGNSQPAPGTARPLTAGNEGARGATPQTTANGGHYVPRPPAGNDSVARGNSSTTGAHGTNSVAESRTPNAGSTQHYGTSNSAPRPTQSSPANRSTSSQYASPARGQSYSSAQSRSGASSVPRPPSNYQYHAAPTYSASSAYGARSPWANSSYGNNRSASSYSGYSNRSSNPYSGSSNRSSSAYGGYSNRSGSPAGYSSGRSYSSTPTYSANRSYAASQAYGRSSGGSSAPHYSAPSAHYSGGGSSYHGGGGGGHSSGGGGGHSGGGHGR